jgi:hypothetical protein
MLNATAKQQFSGMLSSTSSEACIALEEVQNSQDNKRRKYCGWGTALPL